MSILIQLDQKESKEMFKPGGKLKIITKDNVIYGFLFQWKPDETEFLIMNPNGIKKIDYFKCQQIWYTPLDSTGKFTKALNDLQKGSGKLKKPLTNAHTEDIKRLLTETEAFAVYPSRGI